MGVSGIFNRLKPAANSRNPLNKWVGTFLKHSGKELLEIVNSKPIDKWVGVNKGADYAKSYCID